jgi:Putative Flp pilus-assembly TadE/G-like
VSLTYNSTQRKDERGQTLVLVALAIVSLLGMAALAIDVVTLYVAHAEAQRAADSAAIAGAKMFVTSGFTSVQGGLAPPVTQADVCQTGGAGSTAAANRQAEAAVGLNQVAGQAAAVSAINCDFTEPKNPRMTVTVQRTGLPTFLARIWRSTTSTVTASARAEAYNPSGLAAPIQLQNVKPWLVPDCDPTNPGPGDCAAGGYFIDPASGNIQNNGSFVAQTITLIHVAGAATPNVNTTVPRTLNYYRLNVPIRPPQPACPSTAGSCAQVGSDNYHDNIACASTFEFSCGQTIGAGQTVTVLTGGGFGVRTNEGTQCLIHASGQGTGQGQDILTAAAGPLPPITITGGDNNPNTALQGLANISRSDSIVTVPIYHRVGGPNLCPAGCNQTGTIVGFLQLGITQNVPNGTPPSPGANGKIEAIILNAAGCNPGAANPPVSGGGFSALPVRLISP